MEKTKTDYTIKELAGFAGITKPGMQKRIDRIAHLYPKGITRRMVGNMHVYTISDTECFDRLMEAETT